MSYGKDRVGGMTRNPFEPIREGHRFEIPPAALERLSDLARIAAHYRPTFANLLIELFAKAHRWHRLATRSVEMDAVAKELDRIARGARKLKSDIDKLGDNARLTLGLYALRLERFGEVGSHESVRNQIEDLLQSGSANHSLQKVEALSRIIDRIASAAATETWPKPKTGFLPPWKTENGRSTPYIDTFNRFVTELGEAVRTCKGAVRFEHNAISDDLRAFLKAASPYLPNSFTPQEVFAPAPPATE
ncbi:MAG TPA: hypothetical protein VE986_08135, partial [Hyphomicrobiales bacterium]|nr:hypothetical protein [Hyphomicrobiales bacterium]